MPIEIKELQIRATITGAGDMSSDNAMGGHKPGIHRHSGKISARDRENIIAECIDQIMQILKEKDER